MHGLTLLESEVLALIATGLSNADVASALFLGVNTVKTHIRAAYRKAGVTSRSPRSCGRCPRVRPPGLTSG